MRGIAISKESVFYEGLNRIIYWHCRSWPKRVGTYSTQESYCRSQQKGCEKRASSIGYGTSDAWCNGLPDAKEKRDKPKCSRG
jgi:hypothetical protein